MKSRFSRRSDDLNARRSRRRRGREAGLLTEQLERRQMMAVGVFSPVAYSSLGSSFADWFVVTSDNADSVYLQQVATVPQDLLIADNASFNNAQNLNAFHAEGVLWNGIGRFKTTYVTNGTAVNATNVSPNENGDGSVSTFVLSKKVADRDPAVVGVIGSVKGRVSYAGNSWDFTNGGSGDSLSFTLASTGYLSNPSLIRPVSGRVVTVPGGAAGDLSGVTISWSAPALAATAASGPTISTITYDTSATTTTTPATTQSEAFLGKSSGSNPVIQLPVTQANPGGIVPGTLGGSITVDGYTVGFRINTLFRPVNGPNSLLFANNGTASTTGTVVINQGTANAKTVNVTADVDYDNGTIFLEFKEGGNWIDPGPVSLNAHYAIYNQGDASNSLTFAPGLTFEKDVYADLLTPGSTVNIDSPILQNTGNSQINGQISIRATNVNINAQVQAKSYLDIARSVVDRNAIRSRGAASAIVNTAGNVTSIAIPSGKGGQGYDDAIGTTVGFDVQIQGGGGSGATAKAYSTGGTITRVVVTDPGQGYTSLPKVTLPEPDSARFMTLGTAVAEQLNFNAAVAAPQFDLRVANDPHTPEVPRGKLFVSSNGSLSASLDGATPAGSVYVQADSSDIYSEGQVYATQQTFILRSPSNSPGQQPSPFVFTTDSPLTGARTGLIRGSTVAVTLGNDLPTPEEGAVASNIVNLRTQIDSLRIRAATRYGAPLNGPFPYDLKIDEVDDISFDAVAASSRPISLSAAGNILFTAVLSTAGDLSIAAGKDFTVSAPLSTARGTMKIVGGSITLGNSIRVLDPSVDEAVDDIALTATSGDLRLTGAVTAVNNVRLIQRNKTGLMGKIFGPSRIVARGLTVNAEGSADVRTDIVTLAGQSGGDFSLDELNDITITTLQSPGTVTLHAAGFDPGPLSPTTPNIVALTANLQEVTRLEASAPKGSISIVSNTSKPILLGNPATIGSGKAASMQAAGSVEIRSTAGAMTVADAPLGGGSATAVRLATIGNLDATFAYNTPGVFPSTLTNKGVKTALTIDGVALRSGDRVLVKDQAAGWENGIYVATTVGNAATNWTLTRAIDADTTAELQTNTFVQVAEGTAAGKVFSIGFTPTVSFSPLAVETVANHGQAVRVRAATTSTMAGVYDPNLATITASAFGSLPAIDGVSLAMGDFVLVRLGAVIGGAAANGVYEVTSLGGDNSDWILTRAIEPDSGNPIGLGFVVTTEGSYRASLTGQAFQVSYDSLGNDPMKVDLVGDSGRPTTNIGTQNINCTTTFVVSSTAGTNDSAGSLGKILGLFQANDTSSSTLNPNQKTEFRFASILPGVGGAPAGAIRLTQELPAITKAFAIDGVISSRTVLPGTPGTVTISITVDGSRINSTRSGSPATSATEVNGFEFKSGSGSTNGLPGGSLASLTVSGFSTGSAIKINGVKGILVKTATLGRNESGERLTNKVGVLVTGAGAEGTVSGSTIVASTDAGIKVESDAAGASVVGSTIGVIGQSNALGLAFEGGMNRVGGVPASTSVQKITTFFNGTILAIPATLINKIPSPLFLGQSVSGSGIASGTVIAAINERTITLSKPMTRTGSTSLVLGQPKRNTVQGNLYGAELAGGITVACNSDFGNNTYDGIHVSGGRNFIGVSKTRDRASNAIYGNGQWGVNVSTAASGSTFIVGNFFGTVAQATAGPANAQGDVAVDNVLAPAYTPSFSGSKRVAFDGFGNQHVMPTARFSLKHPWR